MATHSLDTAHVIPQRAPIAFRGHDRRHLTALDRGAFVRADEWDALFREAHLRTLVAVVWPRIAHERPALSHATALAMHGLPVYDTRSDRIELITPGTHTRHNARVVVRHHTPLPDGDVAMIDGIRVTSLERTIYDVIRLGSLEAAVIAMDAALHRIAWNDDVNEYDEDAAEAFRAGILRRIVAGRGARGIRQARFVVDFADGRAASPGESLLRLRIWQVGLFAVEPQYRVDLDRGRYALLDLAAPKLRSWFEFDGGVKLTDPVMLAGRTAAEVLADQAARRREIERVTGWRGYHAEWRDAVTLDAFVAYLRGHKLLS